MKPHANTMGSNLCIVENPNHRGSTYRDSRASTTKTFQKRIDGPDISSPLAEVRRTPTGHAEQLAPSHQTDSKRAARTGVVFQSFFLTFRDEATAPATDCLDVDLQTPCGLTHAWVLFKHQEDSCAKNFPMRAAILTNNLRQLPSLSRCQTYPYRLAPSTLCLHASDLITSVSEWRSNYWDGISGLRN